MTETPSHFPPSVIESFRQQRERFPDKDAVVCTDAISYDRLHRYSNRIAHGLIELGQRRLPIATFLGNGIDYIAALLGIGKSGNLFLPMELHWPGARIAEVMALVAPRVVLTDGEGRQRLLALIDESTEPAAGSAAEPATGGLPGYFEHAYLITLAGADQFLTVERFVAGRPAPVVAMAFADTEPAIEVQGADSQYLLSTSGSTGTPKVIEGVHRCLAHFLAWERAELDLGHEVRCLAMAPVSFDVSLRDIFLPLSSGGTVFVPAPPVKENPAALLRWVGACRINVAHLVPSVIRLLIQACADAPELKDHLSSLRYLLSAGEPLYGSDVLGIRESINPRLTLINLYGLTETTLAKVFYRIPPSVDPHRIMPLGRALPDTKILVMAGDRVCDPGEVGEICIQTAYPAKGFFGNDALTREKYRFVENGAMVRFATRDLGLFDEDGLLLYRGRIDDQVKIRGNRVELVEIEQCLARRPELGKVALAPCVDGEHELSLLCFYLPAAGAAVDHGELYRYLDGELPKYMHPSRFIAVPEFPLRANGKLDRQTLLERFGAAAAPVSAQTPPSGEIETKLAAFWRAIFKTEHIYRESSFAALGGSSLNAMRLIARINNEFGLILQIADIFACPTLGDLARRIGRDTGAPAAAGSGGLPPIAPAPVQPSYPLSSFQQAVWDLSHYEPLQIAYNEAVCYRVEREIDAAAAQAAIERMVRKYEILRTSFHQDDAGCRQQILPFRAGGHTPELIDLRRAADPLASFEQHFRARVGMPFDLARPPLFRCTLYRIGDRVTIVSVILFHIVVDLWSVELMLKELLEPLDPLSRREPPAGAPKLQYKDYAVWQIGQMDAEAWREHRQFWREYLRGEIPPMDLSARPRPPIKGYDGGLLVAAIDAAQTASIRRHAGQCQVSLFAYLLTAFARLVHRQTGRDEVAIGIPVSVREHPDLEEQFGNFLNILPLRIPVTAAAGPSLEVVNAHLLRVLSHKSYPIQEMIRDRGDRPDLSRSPFFDISFTVVATTLAHGHPIRELRVNKGTSKYDLSVFIYDAAENIEVAVEYNTDLFVPSEIGRLVDRFLELLPLAS